MPGRPTKLTPALQKQLCDLIARGISQEAAAGVVGIGERTFYRWLAQGESGRGAFWQFRQAVTRARGECEAELLKLVGRHAISDWRAAAWLLERKWPERYRDQSRVELNLTNRFARMSDAELEAYIVASEAARPGEGEEE